MKKRYRAIYVIDFFLDDTYQENESYEEHQDRLSSESKIKAEQIKKDIEQLIASKYGGGTVQINDIQENKFASL